MEWSDEAIVLRSRRHGESDLISVLLSFENGRHAGLVRGGASRRQWPNWQTGNRLEVVWQARIADQLGQFKAEMLEPIAARFMQDPARLSGLSAACAMIDATLPERQPYPQLYATLLHFFTRLERDEWALDYIRFELLLLEALGFALQLESCAVTGTTQNLSHVSPKTGRAVCAEVAAPYADKLLPLPGFLQDGHAYAPNDVAQGLRLAGFYFARHVFAPADRALPVARDRLVGLLIDNSQLDEDDPNR